ncbi:uncharacterized protein CC84DRAFT_1208382 [Paraphaeosphaeria sporulosa]|uniref:Uncharacterized protein n=1 Tax=Paraphaeosphaeria sporulosa TaxID=1460663 RepID=A0A177C648_9PLEO|nr:uncharacterized protein CC84DRAFT_1208382 [Paraphaeosphaeria sporulosa]OAG02352.1 hypothetical protein CC84DRAFT_1208382 [Paraphaeosphaeria sporulosa]
MDVAAQYNPAMTYPPHVVVVRFKRIRERVEGRKPGKVHVSCHASGCEEGKDTHPQILHLEKTFSTFIPLAMFRENIVLALCAAIASAYALPSSFQATNPCPTDTEMACFDVINSSLCLSQNASRNGTAAQMAACVDYPGGMSDLPGSSKIVFSTVALEAHERPGAKLGFNNEAKILRDVSHTGHSLLAGSGKDWCLKSCLGGDIVLRVLLSVGAHACLEEATRRFKSRVEQGGCGGSASVVYQGISPDNWTITTYAWSDGSFTNIAQRELACGTTNTFLGATGRWYTVTSYYLGDNGRKVASEAPLTNMCAAEDKDCHESHKPDALILADGKNWSHVDVSSDELIELLEIANDATTAAA